MNDLNALILQYFNNTDSLPWFPGLGQKLAEKKWIALEKQTKLNRDNYSTEACLSSKKILVPSPFAYILQNQILVSSIPSELALSDKQNKVRPYNADELLSLPILGCVDDAFKWLKLENSIIDTISILVRNIHLLKLEDDEYDVSYSLPNIPFSVFISVPSKRLNNDSLRVAEAILHETMHLQLTLIEEIIPLVKSSSQKYFSPWKNEYRNARGIIHALYVFRTIREFFKRLLITDITQPSQKFLIKRKEEIENQLMLLNNFGMSDALTEEGKLLSMTLIKSI